MYRCLATELKFDIPYYNYVQSRMHPWNKNGSLYVSGKLPPTYPSPKWEVLMLA